MIDLTLDTPKKETNQRSRIHDDTSKDRGAKFSEGPAKQSNHDRVFRSPLPLLRNGQHAKERLQENTAKKPVRTPLAVIQETRRAKLATTPIVNLHRDSRQESNYRQPAPSRFSPSRPPGIEDIADVLNQINEAILQQLSGRLEGVSRNVRSGRSSLLAEAVTDLENMRSASVRKFNSLIKLEEEYATFGRNIKSGLADLVKTNQAATEDIRKVIEGHDRGSLIKHMPKSLFNGPFPQSILSFKE